MATETICCDLIELIIEMTLDAYDSLVGACERKGSETVVKPALPGAGGHRMTLSAIDGESNGSMIRIG